MEDSVVNSCGAAPGAKEGSSSLVQYIMPFHIQETESMPCSDSEWTNEKHSLYLKSMEATFVEQLHRSLDLFGQNSPSSGSKASKLRQTGAPSTQFKILRDGCWSKIGFRRDGEEIKQVESGGLLSNPWIQHYRSSARHATRKCVPHNSQQWPQDPVGSDTEVTDQNFYDEELQGEKSSRTHQTKRTRTFSDTAASNDQVVPLEHIIQHDDATEDHLMPLEE